MEKKEAIEMLRFLHDVIPTFDNELFLSYKNSKVQEAIFFAIEGLEEGSSKKVQPRNAGKPWTQELDAALISHFKEGCDVSELSALFLRTSGSIRSRLVRLNLLQDHMDVNTETRLQGYLGYRTETIYVVNIQERLWIMEIISGEENMIPELFLNKIQSIMAPFYIPKTPQEYHWAIYARASEDINDCIVDLFLERKAPRNTIEQELLNVLKGQQEPINAKQSIALAQLMGWRDSEYGVMPDEEWEMSHGGSSHASGDELFHEEDCQKPKLYKAETITHEVYEPGYDYEEPVINNNFETEEKLQDELLSDNEAYARSEEDGWYYGDG